MNGGMKALVYFEPDEGSIEVNSRYDLLQEKGFDLDIFETAGEAEHCISGFKYDLVLLQLPVPTYDSDTLNNPSLVGLELARRARSTPQNASAKVIMLKGLEDYRENAMNAGVDVYFQDLSGGYTALGKKIDKFFPNLSK